MDINQKEFFLPLEKLYRASIRGLICDESAGESETLSRMEISRLIGISSTLSLSGSDEDVNLSYEIISRLLELYSSQYPQVASAADVIFSRIGNFPGRNLLRTRYTGGIDPSVSMSLSLERLAREAENSIDNSTLLTNFQYRLYTSLEGEKSLSVSAPTSAGKSFVLNMDLMRRLSSRTDKCIVYVVPTRALITEVAARIRSAIREQNITEAIVRTAPFPLESRYSSYSIVYVLTQERLLSLLKPENSKQPITSIFVDEAHEIYKGKRGVVLQNAIDLVLQKYPSVSILFASPLIKNPGYFLGLFNRLENGYFFTEKVSPVSQNIILVSSVHMKPKSVNLKLLTNNFEIDIGDYDLGLKFRPPIMRRRAAFARIVTRSDESTIVFANGPGDAEELASELKDAIFDFTPSEDIKDFISFIKTEIHEEHPLISCLEKGVAFHYGDLPSIVRSGIESFFKAGDVRYLCSTSTLLQGVNLPAKHIIIENPKSGLGNPMRRPDFLNLAGRAGRLLKEFQGNVWCLTPDLWEEKSFEGERLQEIQSSMSKVMADGGTLIQKLMDSSISSENEKELAEAGLGRLYHESVELGVDDLRKKYESAGNADELAETIDLVSALVITLPRDLLDTHRALRPDHLQALYNKFMSASSVESFNLLLPFEIGGKDRMKFAVSTICEAFDWSLSELQFLWYCGVAHKWVTGEPVGKIIRDRVNKLRESDPGAAAPPIIRSILGVIEKKIRFSLVKYFSAYEDILRQATLDREQSLGSIKIAPYHTFLEFGSCNKVELSLMALGFSRFTAIRLRERINWADAIEPEDYLNILSKKEITSLGLPRACQYEIKDVLGL
ncbi:DEAD/DEAH box helicase [Pseudomonas nitroreducens]|uniref:DEAD/DEAH box helicase n=1 Tax=Pseudomonas nitroreducens TaxID=46680 RepID=UPI001FB6A615|nr:DEAD/DEAH box helicase [Pseudomonas nitroreducens]MCJ1879346.1 DEAD/DEAH box helicase [Pseudomonas nitroreducens]MCJ1896641.1 DEAD/DEAH box helicase [Pseudomonas nitroreducens]